MEGLLNSERTVSSLAELEQFWKDFLPQLKNRAILLLSGDVGAGKTTSVQMMAKSLGMRDVQSPSFAIHLRYENAAGKYLDHFFNQKPFKITVQLNSQNLIIQDTISVYLLIE